MAYQLNEPKLKSRKLSLPAAPISSLSVIIGGGNYCGNWPKRRRRDRGKWLSLNHCHQLHCRCQGPDKEELQGPGDYDNDNVMIRYYNHLRFMCLLLSPLLLWMSPRKWRFRCPTFAHPATPTFEQSSCYCRLSTCCQKPSSLNEYEHLRLVGKSNQSTDVLRHLSLVN